MNLEKYIINTKETTCNIVQTEIESIRRKNIQQTGLRIYDNGKMGVAGALGAVDNKELEKQAKSALEFNIPYTSEITKNHQESHDYRKKIIDKNEFIKEMEDLLITIKKNQPDFSFGNKIKIVEKEISLSNDAGLDLSYKDNFLSIGLTFKENSSLSIMDGSVFATDRKYDKDAFIQKVNKICTGYQKKCELPEEGKIPVIFFEGNGDIVKKFYSDLNGRLYGTGGSLLDGKMGEKLFNENFTFYQNRNPEMDGAIFFDAEGHVNKELLYPLIKDGVFLHPYTDKKISSQYNLPHTGCAHSSYDGIPGIAFPGEHIKRSSKTLVELLEGKTALLVYICAGGDFTPDGDFGTPVQLGFLTDGQNILGRVPECQVSSNLFNMFGDDFKGVSSDPFFEKDKTHSIVMEMEMKKL